MRSAPLPYPRWRSINDAERIAASGFAIDFPAMSGALPWTLCIFGGAYVRQKECKWCGVAGLGGTFDRNPGVPQRGGRLYPYSIVAVAICKFYGMRRGTRADWTALGGMVDEIGRIDDTRNKHRQGPSSAGRIR